MSAVAALAAASAAGIEVWLEDGRLRWRAVHPDPEILDQLRACRAEVLDVLHGDRCRRCGSLLAWPAAVGVVHGDGLARCLGCYEAAMASGPSQMWSRSPPAASSCARMNHDPRQPMAPPARRRGR